MQEQQKKELKLLPPNEGEVLSSYWRTTGEPELFSIVWILRKEIGSPPELAFVDEDFDGPFFLRFYDPDKIVDPLLADECEPVRDVIAWQEILVPKRERRCGALACK